MLQFYDMKQLIFSTGNAEKFAVARQTCVQNGIDLIQQDVDITEIQAEDARQVAVDKAVTAFAAIGKPVVITDDAWSFAGLRGFPGVYMHSMNIWFTPEDFLRLTLPLENRQATLTAHLVYVDANQQKVFTQQTKGQLLKETRGTSKYASHTIMAMDGYNGLSIAEAYAQTKDKSTMTSARIWHEFAVWYSTYKPES